MEDGEKRQWDHFRCYCSTLTRHDKGPGEEQKKFESIVFQKNE